MGAVRFQQTVCQAPTLLTNHEVLIIKARGRGRVIKPIPEGMRYMDCATSALDVEALEW